MQAILLPHNSMLLPQFDRWGGKNWLDRLKTVTGRISGSFLYQDIMSDSVLTKI